jgi:hypothetical protein
MARFLVLIYIAGHESWRSSELNQSCAETCIGQGHVTLQGAILIASRGNVPPSPLFYYSTRDNMNHLISLFNEAKCENLWLWPLPGQEPVVKAPVFIRSLVLGAVVKSTGHKDDYCHGTWGSQSGIAEDSSVTRCDTLQSFETSGVVRPATQRNVPEESNLPDYCASVWNMQ